MNLAIQSLGSSVLVTNGKFMASTGPRGRLESQGVCGASAPTPHRGPELVHVVGKLFHLLAGYQRQRVEAIASPASTSKVPARRRYDYSGVRVIGVVRPEPDMDKLVRAVRAMAQHLAADEQLKAQGLEVPGRHDRTKEPGQFRNRNRRSSR